MIEKIVGITVLLMILGLIFISLYLTFYSFFGNKKKEKLKKEKMAQVDLTEYVNLIRSCTSLKDLKEKKKYYNKMGTIIIIAEIITTGFVYSFLVKINLKISEFLFFVYIALAIMILLNFSLKSRNVTNLYNEIYKKNIINNLLKSIDSNVSYSPDSGITRNQYDSGNFEKYDIFRSEDKICSTFNNIQFILADVTTINEQTDSDGNKSCSTVFAGTVALAGLPKNLNSFIYVIRSKTDANKNKFYVQSDNTEFEKNYDVFSDNNILSMRLLTPNLTNIILDFERQTNLNIEIRIIYNTIFFRFHGSNLFEPSFENELQEAYNAYESICKYNTIKSIINEIVNNVNNLEM